MAFLGIWLTVATLILGWGVGPVAAQGVRSSTDSTDIFRYDTLRVLDNDDVYYIGAEPTRQVRWTWGMTTTADKAVELQLWLHIS